MNKFIKYILLIVAILLALSPFVFYFMQFGSNKFSDDLNIWYMFGQFVGGTLGPYIALLTLAITAWIAIEFNTFQKQQTTIQLFKEFRTYNLRNARKLAWEVKKNWNNSELTNYREKFINALISEKAFKNNTFSISEKQIQSVYDLFAFYSMLSTYSTKNKVMPKLNYFYYAWWRKFLYEVAEMYDERRIRTINDENLNKKSFKEFVNNIKLKPKLIELDKVCGFDKNFFLNDNPLDIYKENSK